jgi:hypothetical protein
MWSIRRCCQSGASRVSIRDSRRDTEMAVDDVKRQGPAAPVHAAGPRSRRSVTHCTGDVSDQPSFSIADASSGV